MTPAAQWPPGFQGTKSRPRWLTEGGEGGGGVGGEEGVRKTESEGEISSLKAVLNWAKHSVHEQLCLLEIFKLAVWFLIHVFDLGEQVCSRPMGRRSDVRNVGSAG